MGNIICSDQEGTAPEKSNVEDIHEDVISDTAEFSFCPPPILCLAEEDMQSHGSSMSTGTWTTKEEAHDLQHSKPPSKNKSH